MIRPIARADLPAVGRLWRSLMAAGAEADPSYRTVDDPLAAFAPIIEQEWTRIDPFVRCFVAGPAGAPFAFVTLYPLIRPPVLAMPPAALIGDVFVAPEHRRGGVGRQLVSVAARTAHEAGFPGLEVGTLVRDARAVAFWRGLGFVEQRVTLVRGAS